jgi:lactate dehydrogenase-like 2-hydroxyacid dehydrogenase
VAEKPRIIMFHEALAKRMAVVLESDFEVAAPGEGEERMAWLEANGRGVRLLVVVGFDPVNATVLDRLPDLQHIQVFGAGMDQVDLKELKRRGISIENAGDVHAGEVADFAMALMLAARRELLKADSVVRNNEWKGAFYKPSRSLTGAKVGVAGLGHIGSAIARRAEPFDTEVAWWGPRDKPEVKWPRFHTLLELAKWADILFIAVFAHDETKGIVTREVLDALGPDGLIVNVSRGFVIDEDALIAALRDGRLGQAALDVFETEPTPAERWADVPNLVLSPHCAGSTINSYGTLERRTAERLRAWFGLEVQ